MNQLRKKGLYLATMGGYTLANLSAAFATDAGSTSPIDNPLNGIDNFGQLISFIINLLLGLIGFVAVIYLIWAGFKYVTAGGDSKQAGEAKEGITHAIIGLAIAFIGYLLVGFVYDALNVDSNIQEQVFSNN